VAGAVVVMAPLATVLGAPPASWAVTQTSGNYLWGVDSVESAAANLSSIERLYGAAPAFWGRYLSDCARDCDGDLSSAEISQDHADGLNLLLLVADLTGPQDQGSANGTQDANGAVAAARADGVPGGVAIFKDFEAGSTPDAAFIEAWYDTVAAAGYAPGFYEDSDTGFAGAYCSAVASDPEVGRSYLYASESEPGPGSSGPGSAPAFSGALFPGCAGNRAAWQYTEGDAGDVDEDEAALSTPLWGPSGVVSYSVPATPSLTASPPSVSSSGGSVTLTASDTRPVATYHYSSSPTLSGLSSCSSTTCTVQIPANMSLDDVTYTFSVTATNVGGTSAPGTTTVVADGLDQSAENTAQAGEAQVQSVLPTPLQPLERELSASTASLLP